MIRLLFIDDEASHFTSLQDYLADICASMRVKHTIERLFVTAEDVAQMQFEPQANGKSLSTKEKYKQTLVHKIQARLSECRASKTHVILIFDNLMVVPGGSFYLDEFITQLWFQEPDGWLENVPIIGWVSDLDRRALAKLDKHPRNKSKILSNIPTAGALGLRQFEEALRAALQ